MKNLLYLFLTGCLFICLACDETGPPDEADGDMEEMPDYEGFDNNVNVIRDFIAAYSAEDTEKIASMLSDTMKWIPAVYSDKGPLGKNDYVTHLAELNRDFDNIKFDEGIMDNGERIPGFWSGSVFPKDRADNKPDVIRVYGTFSGSHVESGNDVKVKFFALASVNEDGQIVLWDSYYDVPDGGGDSE